MAFQIKGRTYGANGESLDWDLWDRWTVAASTQTQLLFRDGFGSNGKRLDQSNMVGDGRMADGSGIMVRKIVTQYLPNQIWNNANLLDWHKFLFTTVLEIVVNGKDVLFQQKLSRLLGIAAPVIHLPTVAGDQIVPYNQKPMNNEFICNIGIPLDQNVNFSIQLVPGVAAAAILVSDFLDISLNGELGRLS